MKINTKTGDDGTTGLFNGVRVSKNSLRVNTYGTVDETNSILGLVMSFDLPDDMRNDIKTIQELLFQLGSDLATPNVPPPRFKINRISEEPIKWLESKIDEYDLELPDLKSFILPGGSKSASFLHTARTVCRRAERLAVELESQEEINPNVVMLLNRLSDYFFTAARYCNHLNKIDDIKWESK